MHNQVYQFVSTYDHMNYDVLILLYMSDRYVLGFAPAPWFL